MKQYYNLKMQFDVPLSLFKHEVEMQKEHIIHIFSFMNTLLH